MNNLYKFLFLLLFSLPFVSSAQTEVEKAEAMVEDAFGLLDDGKVERGLELLKASNTIFEKEGSWANYLDVGYEIGNTLSFEYRDEEAVEAYNQYIKVGEEKLPDSEQLGALYHKLGVSLFLLFNYPDAETAYGRAIQIRRKALGDDNLDLARSIFNLGVVKEETYKFDEAIELMAQSLAIRKKSDDGILQGFNYSNIGIVQSKKGDYDLAISNFDRALELFEGNTETKVKLELGRVYNEMGGIFRNKKDYQKSLVYFYKNLGISEDTEDYQGQASSMQNVASILMEQEDFPRAERYYRRGLNAAKKAEPTMETDVLMNTLIIDIADCITAQEKYDDALRYLDDIQDEVQESALASFYNTKANTFSKAGRVEESLKEHYNTFEAVIEGFKAADNYAVPEIKENNIKGSKIFLLEYLADLGDTYQENAKADSKRLEAALSAYQQADQVIDLMRKEHSEDNSKLFWTELAVPIYEKAISASLKLNRQTNDAKFLEAAFNFSEKSKSIVLLDAIKETNARKFAGVPDDILDEEMELKVALSYAEQDLFAEQQMGEDADVKVIEDLKAEILELKTAYKAFVDKLEVNYPGYYNMRYADNSITLEQLKELLADDQGMIQYFEGDSSLYVFLITKETIQVESIKKDFDLTKWVEDLRLGIYGYQLGSQRTDERYQELAILYSENGLKLYQKLIEPLKANLPKRLIISPSGVISYIPFEVLLTKKPAKASKFKILDYLINDYSISYSYSATLLKEMVEKKVTPKFNEMLAFAPAFGDDAVAYEGNRRYVLSPLIYNTKEVEMVSKIFSGKVLQGAEAKESEFKNLAADYSIIHCATHGKANDENPNYSYLAFTNIEDSLENEFLYVRDLYNMELNAEMVVLSACETGLGKLYKGEGVASMARGFSYAGAKSIITTLWSVNDRSTFEIMDRFYNSLKNGTPKDIALSDAKRDFIQTQDNIIANPFYWAPYIAIGSSQAITVQQAGFPWMWIGIGAGIILLLGLLARLRRKSA